MQLKDKSRIFRKGLAFNTSGVAVALALRAPEIERARAARWAERHRERYPAVAAPWGAPDVRVARRNMTPEEKAGPCCRECGAPYGFDRLWAHVPGCANSSPAGVCADDCDWPTL